MKKLVGLFALAAATAAAPLQAQTVNFTGTTLGCFYTTVMCDPAASSPLAGGSLTFQGGSFNVTTSNGFVGVGNEPMEPNNFGSFSLPATVIPQTLPATGTNFLLHIVFSTPSTVSPNPVPFMATVSGSVSGDAQGGYSIDFDQTPMNITWEGGSGTVRVNNVNINNASIETNTAITGRITANQTAVPEPATVLLLGSGLAGLAVTARRRRTNV